MVKEWTLTLQEDIRQLYQEENRPLSEVMRLVKGRHGFVASERSYRSQLRKWGYMKYNTQSFTRPGLPGTLQPPIDQSGGSSILSHNLPGFSFDTLFSSTSTASASVNNQQYGGLGQGLDHGSVPHLSFHFPNDGQEDGQGGTPLHRAVINGNTQQVQSLLFAGAAINVKDQLGKEPLHYAIEGATVETTQLLLRYGANVNTKGPLGRSPLHLATTNASVLEALLQQGPELSVQDDKGDTPLHLAVSMKNFATIDLLVGAKCDVNKHNKEGFTPFHKLVSLTYDDAVYDRIKAFLVCDADVNVPLPNGRTPFQVVLSIFDENTTYHRHYGRTRLAIVKLFLEKGASVLTSVKSGEPFVEHFFEKIFRWETERELSIILCRASGNGHFDRLGLSLLHILSAKCRNIHGQEQIPRLVKIVLDNGADPNYRNADGRTPLLVLLQTKTNACRNVQNVVSLLLARGADPFMQDSSGACPIFEVPTLFAKNSAKVFRLFLAADISPRRGSEMAEDGHNDASENPAWVEWNQAVRSDSWPQSMHLILDSTVPLSSTMGKSLKEVACAVLAEVYVREAMNGSKDQFDDMAQKRGYVAGILRDCRANHAPVAVETFDLLLDLCEREMGSE